MADYINIYGQDILAVASDPANPTVGQIWYNTTSNTLKGESVTTAGTWATSNNMNTARSSFNRRRNANSRLLLLVVMHQLQLQQQQKNYDGTSWSSSPTIWLQQGVI
jgi:hypothetical protein